MTYWRRNLMPCSCPPRRRRHKRCSASVMSLRSSRAKWCCLGFRRVLMVGLVFSEVTAVVAWIPLPPPLPSPAAGFALQGRELFVDFAGFSWLGWYFLKLLRWLHGYRYPHPCPPPLRASSCRGGSCSWDFAGFSWLGWCFLKLLRWLHGYRYPHPCPPPLRTLARPAGEGVIGVPSLPPRFSARGWRGR